MGEIILVRHGQANSAARDEASYDRLSDLGHAQAAALGDWMRDRGMVFDKVLAGTLNRHRSTAEAMGYGDVAIADARLNEMDYFNLGLALAQSQGVPMPAPEDFPGHVAKVMEAWHAAEIRGNESFAEFEARIAAVLEEASEPGRKVLCVTSGGVIGMVLRHLLLLDPTRLANVLLPIWNTSIHRVHVRPHGTILAGFNAIPHLEQADRDHLRTHF
ncbi:histidine phosphatase family protein [Roseisalinus antarcticus]|uniref:Bifunctional RNase H/acid phosphatase n=1 Tax=Roseisalinus antarcticus TaxID=254357 RepID=A0A1Y5SPI0_9RHOB|nr:histidine phosphatase family protein [Roseisalinus antarcticus]SLN43702.1 bifunctional RNase H/acid phosphatase [Roseisalinus antarcticus]